jgi:hypothetical protein
VLGSRFIIDPTIDAGLGYIFKDWADRDLDDDPDNPIAATAYGYLGAGVGVNIWRLGLYSKFIWHFPMGPLQGSGGGGTNAGSSACATTRSPRAKIILG